jgi:hypothetical protein
MGTREALLYPRLATHGLAAGEDECHRGFRAFGYECDTYVLLLILSAGQAGPIHWTFMLGFRVETTKVSH